MFDIENNPEDPNAAPVAGAKIIVIGIGGGGCNAVNTMIREGLSGVKYIVANTDIQALQANLAEQKIQLGTEITKGLGAGANPEVGKQAAMEDYDQVAEALKGADMVFITAGMGGGTGTGAAPVIAKLSRDLGALTVGVVTKPFRFEGKKRKRQAEEGILELEGCVDSLITIPNEKLLELAGEDLTLVETFRQADGVLLNAVRGISDLINNTGLINADFADVATVMANKGLALMGTGTARGEERSKEAARIAINSPLLDDVSIEGATGIIVNISGDASLTTSETNKAMNLIMDEADEDAEIIFGTVIDEALGDAVKVTVIATGLGGRGVSPSPTKTYSSPTNTYTQRSTPTNNMATASAVAVEEVVETTTPIDEKEAQDFIDETFSAFDVVESDIEEAPEAATEEPLVFDASEVDVENEEVSASFDSSESEETYEEPSENNAEVHASESDDLDEFEDEDSREEARGFGRAKRIAQKLGFMNFDDDEFDKPAHQRSKESSDH